MDGILYRNGYKYQLVEPATIHVPELRGYDCEDAFYRINNGHVTARRGYAWDGLTGAIDNASAMTPSLVHDIVCQAVGEKLLPLAARTPLGDNAFHRLMIERGTPKLIADWRWWSVDRYVALRGAGTPKPILWAP